MRITVFRVSTVKENQPAFFPKALASPYSYVQIDDTSFARYIPDRDTIEIEQRDAQDIIE